MHSLLIILKINVYVYKCIKLLFGGWLLKSLERNQSKKKNFLLLKKLQMETYKLSPWVSFSDCIAIIKASFHISRRLSDRYKFICSLKKIWKCN